MPVAPHSNLTTAEAAELAASLQSFAGPWSLARHESYDGQLLLLVCPDDEALASFAVTAEAGGLGLAVLRDDELLDCGRFETMGGVIAALRDLTLAETARDERPH